MKKNEIEVGKQYWWNEERVFIHAEHPSGKGWLVVKCETGVVEHIETAQHFSPMSEKEKSHRHYKKAAKAKA